MPWRIVLAVVVLLGAGVIVFAVMRGGGSKPQASKQYTRPLPPQSADAYQRGGVPLHDEALEALLRDGLATADTFAMRDALIRLGALPADREIRAEVGIRSPVPALVETIDPKPR